MPRNLPALIEAEIVKDATFTFHLIEFQFDTGTIYFSTLPRNILFNSNLYIAGADMISFGNVVESQNVELGSMTFKLSGVDLTNVAQALTEDFMDRPVILRRAFLSTINYSLLADPFIIYEGRITSFKLNENPATGMSDLTWNTASMWADFQTTSGRRSNNNDQQIRFPGDKAFEYAHLTTFDLRWGRK